MLKKGFTEKSGAEHPNAVWMGDRLEWDARTNPPKMRLTVSPYHDLATWQAYGPAIEGHERVYRIEGDEFREHVSKPTIEGSRYQDQATAIEEYLLAKLDTPSGTFTEHTEEDGAILQIPVMQSYFDGAEQITAVR